MSGRSGTSGPAANSGNDGGPAARATGGMRLRMEAIRWTASG